MSKGPQKRRAYFEGIVIDDTKGRIFGATTFIRVGTSDLGQIELVKLGWMEEILI